MFEVKQNNTYQTFNEINQDVYTWKVYNASNVTYNSHNLLEMTFDISDITLMGTEQFMEVLTEVINRFQLRFNHDSFEIDSFKSCQSRSDCASVLSESKSEIFN